MIDKPGIYPGLSWEDYSAIDARRTSELRHFKRSALHARYFHAHPSEPTRQMSFGTAVHCAVFEPDLFEERYVRRIDPGDRRSPANKARWEAFLMANEGKEILSEEDWEKVCAIRASLWSQPWAQDYLSGPGSNELSIVWEDPSWKVPCKARIDRYASGMLLDLKTGADASPEAFRRSISNYDYHLQAAFYLDGLDALEPYPRSWVWIVLESSAPWAVALYEPSNEMLEEGRKRYQTALGQWLDCTRSGNWPGYPPHQQLIDLPPWARSKAPQGEDDVF